MPTICIARNAAFLSITRRHKPMGAASTTSDSERSELCPRVEHRDLACHGSGRSSAEPRRGTRPQCARYALRALPASTVKDRGVCSSKRAPARRPCKARRAAEITGAVQPGSGRRGAARFLGSPLIPLVRAMKTHCSISHPILPLRASDGAADFAPTRRSAGTRRSIKSGNIPNTHWAAKASVFRQGFQGVPNRWYPEYPAVDSATPIPRDETPYMYDTPRLYHPYEQSTLKGDVPIIGEDIFMNLDDEEFHARGESQAPSPQRRQRRAAE